MSDPRGGLLAQVEEDMIELGRKRTDRVGIETVKAQMGFATSSSQLFVIQPREKALTGEDVGRVLQVRVRAVDAMQK